jgi:hypothetical protein
MHIVLLACLALAAVAAPINERMWHNQQVSAAAKPPARLLSAQHSIECANGLRALAACASFNASTLCGQCSSQLSYTLEQCNAQGANGINAWIAAMDTSNPILYSTPLLLTQEDAAAAIVTLDTCRPRKYCSKVERSGSAEWLDWLQGRLETILKQAHQCGLCGCSVSVCGRVGARLTRTKVAKPTPASCRLAGISISISIAAMACASLCLSVLPARRCM